MDFKKISIFSIILLIIIGLITFFFIKNDKKTEDEPKTKVEKEVKNENNVKKEIGEKGKITEEEMKTKLTANNFGETAKIEKYNSNYSLYLTQSGTKIYENEKQGDLLIWVKNDKNGQKVERLNETKSFINLLEDDGKNIINVDGKKLIVYNYYTYDVDGKPYNEEGVVLEITKDNEVKKIYEVKDEFVSAKIENGKLSIKKKEFTDPRAVKAGNEKPYILKTVRFVNGEFK